MIHTLCYTLPDGTSQRRVVSNTRSQDLAYMHHAINRPTEFPCFNFYARTAHPLPAICLGTKSATTAAVPWAKSASFTALPTQRHLQKDQRSRVACFGEDSEHSQGFNQIIH